MFNNNAGFWWFADKILSSLSCSAGDNETGRKPAQLLTQDRYKQGEKKSKNHNLIAFSKLDNSTKKINNNLVFLPAFALTGN